MGKGRWRGGVRVWRIGGAAGAISWQGDVAMRRHDGVEVWGAEYWRRGMGSIAGVRGMA